MLLSTFVTNLVNVGKKLETKLQYFDIYLLNKNILEYVAPSRIIQTIVCLGKT